MNLPPIGTTRLTGLPYQLLLQISLKSRKANL